MTRWVIRIELKDGVTTAEAVGILGKVTAHLLALKDPRIKQPNMVKKGGALDLLDLKREISSTRET